MPAATSVRPITSAYTCAGERSSMASIVIRRVETCYRHPKRETGVRCSNCERPICPDCMTSTPVGMRCPECARQRTKVRTMRSMTDEPRVTYVMIGLCVLAYLGELLSGGGIGGSGTLFEEGALYRAAIQDGED